MPTSTPIRSLTIVIPAYNEAERLPRSLMRIIDWASGQRLTVDLLVVDDGSVDDTARIAEETVGDKLPLTVLRNEPNRGKGFSVRRGMSEARGDCVLFTDADLSTPIEEADRLLAAIAQGADVAIGSRGMTASAVQVHQPWWREKSGQLFGLLVQLLVLPGIHDSQCGFKCFRHEAAKKISRHQTLESWAFDVEVLLIARKLGYDVAEIPIRWVNDPNTKVAILSDGPRMLIDMVRARLRHRRLSPQ